MPTPDEIKRAQIEYLARRLMDQGRVIEAGWMSYRQQMSPTAPAIQLRECRLAFMHGASFLFSAMMHSLEGGEDATEGDLRRMDNIAKELQAFETHFREALKGTPQFTCPRCGAISYNANDIQQSYCGACHDWT